MGWGPQKRWALAQVIFCVILEGKVDRDLLENLADCIVQSFMFNRSCMSVLHHFYKIVGSVARGVVLPLSSTLLEELLAVVPFASLSGSLHG